MENVIGSDYFFLGPAYMDLLGDVISAEAANNITNQIGVPDYYIDDKEPSNSCYEDDKETITQAQDVLQQIEQQFLNEGKK